MPKANDLTGNRYGLFTAIKDVGVLGGERAWKCKCDCGKTIVVRARSLRSGHTKSCGCMYHNQDLVGQKFNLLTVIQNVGKDKNNNHLWLCQCDCGKFTTIKTAKLKNGYIKSCGCYTGKNHGLPNGEADFNNLFYKYRREAKRREYTFELTKDEFRYITSQHCHYCNIEPTEGRTALRANGAYLHNGIDRVDNSKGYTKDNVVACCTFCNYAKHTHSQDEFLDHIVKIYENIVIREKEKLK